MMTPSTQRTWPEPSRSNTPGLPESAPHWAPTIRAGIRNADWFCFCAKSQRPAARSSRDSASWDVDPQGENNPVTGYVRWTPAPIGLRSVTGPLRLRTVHVSAGIPASASRAPAGEGFPGTAGVSPT